MRRKPPGDAYGWLWLRPAVCVGMCPGALCGAAGHEQPLSEEEIRQLRELEAAEAGRRRGVEAQLQGRRAQQQVRLAHHAAAPQQGRGQQPPRRTRQAAA